MGFVGESINTSAVIAEPAGVDMYKSACLAVRYDAMGSVIICDTAGEKALGILPAQTPDIVAKGESVSVQIKDMGLWRSGGTFRKGDLLTCAADGRAVKAASGQFALGMALGASGAAGQLVHVQLCKSGFAV